MKIKLEIKEIANNGYGVGKIGKEVFFIEGGITGETVEVEILRKKKGYSFGVAREVLSSSPHRAKPRCPYYSECGGCQFQHISYPFQLEVKEEILKNLLARIGKINDFPEIIPVMPRQTYKYRGKVRLLISKGKIGFRKKWSNDIVPIEKCPVALDSISKKINEISAYKPSLSDEIILAYDFYEKSVKERGIVSYPVEVNGGKVFLLVDISGFMQANISTNQQIIDFILSETSDNKDGSFLDLYCGAGNFSIPLVLSGMNGTGVEKQGSGIKMAAYNASSAGLNSIKFIESDVLRYASNASKHGEKYDVVILDPPREGAKEVVPFLRNITGKKVIYISCDAAAFARDAALLIKSGFKLTKIHLFDMLPQTYHVEVAGVFE